MQAAFGIDYRKEKQKTVGDPDTNAGLTTTGFIPDIKGQFSVKEAFVELNVPLIAGRTGVHSFDLSTAYRFADYSSIGSVASWNFGLSYAPTESIRFRGQISQAQRAPDITELFSSPRSDFDDVNDPCDNVAADTTGTVANNCRTIPGVQLAIATEGVFLQDGSSIFGPNTGNPNLTEETADTITFGLVFTPTAVDGLSIIVDYYHIEVDDVISSVDSQLAADLCYTDPGYPDNNFCESITRDVDGQIERIINQVENLNSLNAEGIDVTVDYGFEIPRVTGDFDIKLIYSHILQNEESFDGPDGEVTDVFAGEVGLPENEARLTIGWNLSDFYIRYRANYTGSAVDNLLLDSDDPGYYKVSSVTTHDLYGSYTLGTNNSWRIYAGINNIGDDHGPYMPDGYKHGTNYNVHYSYDRIGRNYYAGAKFSWY